MAADIKNIVIIGGGTAGWLAASLLAARHGAAPESGLSVTLIESPDIPTIGVGEGTWPTIRDTLKRIGISESEFLSECDASFKQGSRFDGWINGASDDSYLHPFSAPINGSAADIHMAWKAQANRTFASTISVQSEICAHDLAPRQVSMPPYQGVVNYAYHLDAGKLATLLTRHATEKLGVKHVRDHVTRIESHENGDIKAVGTQNNGLFFGDFFIDCSGMRSLILANHFNIGFRDQSHILFNDRALAVHIPVEQDTAIASQTISTAHEAGWVWDIGLPTRRGIGLVYASEYNTDEAARKTLKHYIQKAFPAYDEGLNIREIAFKSGYREKFWHRNCLAIGMSAGFLEPLEASAIVMIELASKFLSDNFPKNREMMALMEKRFNDLFSYRWGRIIDFLKLHYVLSKRPQPYWQDNRKVETIPARLRELLELWKYQPPSEVDFPHREEIFPAASYQYILYGMGFATRIDPSLRPLNGAEIAHNISLIKQQKRKLIAGLPSNRALLSQLHPIAELQS